MKLTLQLGLLPSASQANALRDVMAALPPPQNIAA
jgi:hypothetical protein